MSLVMHRNNILEKKFSVSNHSDLLIVYLRSSMLLKKIL